GTAARLAARSRTERAPPDCGFASFCPGPVRLEPGVAVDRRTPHPGQLEAGPVAERGGGALVDEYGAGPGDGGESGGDVDGGPEDVAKAGYDVAVREARSNARERVLLIGAPAYELEGGGGGVRR